MKSSKELVVLNALHISTVRILLRVKVTQYLFKDCLHPLPNGM